MPRPESSSTSCDREPSSRARILIVDDDAAIVEALRAALESSYEVVAAANASAALAALDRHSVDVALVDYLLPDASGLAILRRIKQSQPSAIVIFMTGFGSEEVCAEFFRHGGWDYLKKPFRPQDLLGRIQRLLAVRAERGERRAPLFLGGPDLNGPGPVGPGGTSQTARIGRAIAFIEAHLNRPLTLDDVARHADMSRFHFCRAFKRSKGLTFREFLARCRILRATELLLEGDRSIKEVSAEVGFKGVPHFSRIFRKITGEPPSHWRRRLSRSSPD